jgi:hypothetical protein
VRAATVDHQSPILAVIVLALLLAAVVLGQPWRRRRTFVTAAPAEAGGASASLAQAAAPAAARPAPTAAAAVAPALAPQATTRPGATGDPDHRDAPESRTRARRWVPLDERLADGAPASPQRPSAPAPRTPPQQRTSPQQPTPPRRGEPWLREHATQAALVVTAVAGIVARGLSRRGRGGRRR